MENTYLPGTVRERITDLMKEKKVTQAELANQIGSTESTVSRFISGKTDKLSDESIVRIAKAFNISTDFLLGVTNIPDRKNYEIEELGLSAQAARNLYTGRVNADVLNYLLENPRFAEVTHIIDQYFNSTVSAGLAGQNEMYDTISNLLRKRVKTEAAKSAARDISHLKTPVHQAELTTIQNLFMVVLKEIKKEIGESPATAAHKKFTKEMTETMFDELTKGQDMEHLDISVQQIAELVTKTISNANVFTPLATQQFGDSLTYLMESSLTQALDLYDTEMQEDTSDVGNESAVQESQHEASKQ